MTGETIALLGLLALALVLPVAALRDRRLDFGASRKMVVIWLALFVLVAMAFAWIGM